MMSSTSEQYDAKKFPLCAPWDGQRGKSYYETFIPNIASSWGLRGDDFANKQEHLTGNVPGGIPITTPAQRRANNLAVNDELEHEGTNNDKRKSAVQFKNRDASIIAELRNHIPGTAWRDRIDQIKRLSAEGDYEGGAPLIIVVIAANVAGFANGTLLYPAGHLNDGEALSARDMDNYQKCGNSLARHIIRIIGEEASPDQKAGITKMLAENKWANLKLSHVPIDGATPRNLATLIKKVALEHEANEQQQRIKFLSLLVSPPEIAAKAVTELQRCSTHLEKANGEPDFEKLVAEIQELWDLSVTRGNLKLTTKVAGASSSSSSVDAFALNLGCGECSDDGEQSYYVASQAASGRTLQNEMQCWNNHVLSDCT
jgi:hypothetical protein